MFKFLRYFSITSLIALVIVTVLSGVFYRQVTLDNLIELEESKNVALTQAFANSLWPEFAPFVTSASGLDGDELRAHPETAKFRQSVLTQMSGLSVVKVKVYNLEGLTVFSTEASQMGTDKRTNEGFLSARSGEAASELVHRDTFGAFEGEISDRDILESYIPVRRGGPTGSVEGVFELYSDVTPLLQKIERTQRSVVIGTLLIMVILYAALLLIVRRADGIIRGQYIEKEELLGQLQERRENLEERTSDLERQAVQLQAAAEMARVSTSALNLDELLEQVVTLIGDRFGFYYVGLYLLDETRRWAELQAATGEAGRLLLEHGLRQQVGGNSVIGWCTAYAQPRVVQDVSQDATYLELPVLPDVRSEEGLPLMARGRVIGALDVQSKSPDAFSQEIVTVLNTMADQIAVAIDNIHLLAEAQESLAKAQAVHRHYLREAWAGFTAAHVPAAGYRYAAGDVEPDPDAWLPGMAVAQRQSQVVITLDDDGVATFSLPITLRGETIGVLGFKKDGEGEWTDDDVAVAQAAADQVALSLENVRLFDEVRRRAQHESLVRELSDRMRRTTDVDTILETAVQELGKALGSARAFVRLEIPDSDSAVVRPD